MVDFASPSGRGLRLGNASSSFGVMEMTNNYWARSNFVPQGYWGNTGTRPHCFVFTGNEIYDPDNGNHIQEFVTNGTTGSRGSQKIPDCDLWDLNTYGGTFKAQLFANGTNSGNRTLSQWRTSTDAARVTPASAVGFDINSTEVANPTVNKIVVLQSEYICPACTFQNSDYGHIYVVNWENVTTDIVDISSVVGLNRQYNVRYADDFFGTVAASGTCPGTAPCNVILPTKHTNAGAAQQFALAYVITAEP